MPAKEEVNSKPSPSILRAILWASVLIVMDVLITGLPVVGLVVSFLAFISYGLFALVRRIKGDAILGRRYGVKALIYLTATAAIVSGHTLNQKMGAANAERVIAAVESFRRDRNRYPLNLSELEPTYIDKVPPAAVRLSASRFRYRSDGDRTMLVWVVVPPYLRKIYVFERKEWQTMD